MFESVHSVNYNTAFIAFRTCLTKAEENGEAVSDIRTLKRLCGNSLKKSFKTQKQQNIFSFFVKD